MIRNIVLAYAVSILVASPVWSQEEYVLQSPEQLYTTLAEIRDLISDAYDEQQQMLVPDEEFLAMSDSERRMIEKKNAPRRVELQQHIEDGFEAADSVAPALISKLLTAGSLAQVVSRYPSNDILKWVDGGNAYSPEERQRIVWEAESDRAFVAAVYQEYPAGDGNVLYVFEPLRAGAAPFQPNRFNVFPTTPFIVRKTGEDVILHEFGVMSEHETGGFLGMMPAKEGAWPTLAYLAGPDGRGRYVSLFKIYVDEATDSIRGVLVGESSGVVDYRFDPVAGTLNYTITRGLEQPEEDFVHTFDKNFGGPMKYESTAGVHFPIAGTTQRPTPVTEASAQQIDVRPVTNDKGNSAQASSGTTDNGNSPTTQMVQSEPQDEAIREGERPVGLVQDSTARRWMLPVLVLAICAVVGLLVIRRNRSI